MYESATDTILFTVTTWRSTTTDYWVGLGLSRSQSLTSSDLMLSYLRANGNGLVKDFWSSDGSTAILDSTQNVLLDSQWWSPLGSVQSAFRRPMNTGDSTQDYSLTSECFYFLFFVNGLSLGSNDEVTLAQPIASSQKICICYNTTTTPIPSTTPVASTTIAPAVTTPSNSWGNCS